MSNELPTTVRDFIDTVNRHDQEGFLDAFTGDASVDDWGRSFTGRDAIKAWSDGEFIGAEGTMTVTDTSVDGDTVTVIADWRSNHANGLSKFVFEVDGDKLRSMTIREG